MSKIILVLATLLLLMSAPADATKTRPHRTTRIALESLQPGSPFDCDTARASRWFGSTVRCLEELCRGQNTINASVIGGDGRLRKNPCAPGSDDRR